MTAPTEVPLEEIVPHRPPMLFLDSVRRASATSILGRWTAPANGPWVAGGRLDRAALVEFVAQTAAAHAGLWRRERGLALEPGYLGGIDSFRFARDVRAGETVGCRVEMRFRIGNVVRAACIVTDGASREVAAGELSLVLASQPTESSDGSRASAADASRASGTSTGTSREGAADGAARSPRGGEDEP